MDNYSIVNIRETNTLQKVKIGIGKKPELSKIIVEKWQSLLDVISEIIGVPAGLIMQLHEDYIKVFLKSNTDGNPYHKDEKANLVYGLYCETVIGTQKELIVPNALKDRVWSQNNPDVDINMISYMGVPLNWPDGDVFGTLCVLDNKENSYCRLYKDLLYHMKDNLEKDLEIILNELNIREQNEELIRSNQLKTRFLSLISHDIRGALGSINELLDFVIMEYEKEMPERLTHSLNIIKSDSNSIYIALESILQWSKEELFTMTAKLKKTDIAELIEVALRFLEASYSIKNININKDYQTRDLNVRVDPQMFESVIRNLLSNAIKVTPKDREIWIRLYRKKGLFYMEIEDSGIGIPKDTLNRLFYVENEYIIKSKPKTKEQGLGLTIVKDFVDKHGGKIKVSRKEGHGTYFTVVL